LSTGGREKINKYHGCLFLWCVRLVKEPAQKIMKDIYHSIKERDPDKNREEKSDFA
jgi:hypothetical protein